MHNLQLKNTYKQVLYIAFPISLSLFIPQFNLFFNTIFLSHLGIKELANAGIVGVYYLVFAVIGYGFNGGLQTYLSSSAGANNSNQISQYFTNGFAMSVSFSIVAILFTYYFLPSILTSYLGENASTTQITDYLKIRILGLPFLYSFQVINSLLIAINKSKLLPIGATIETLINISLDYILIFGKYNMPKLGFEGAAYASVLAELSAILTVLLILLRPSIRKQLQIKLGLISRSIYSTILKRSFPLMMQHAISVISFWIFFLLLKKNDELGASLTQPIRIVYGLCGICCWALANTTNALVSNFIGQGLQNHIPSIIKKILIISLSITSFTLIILHSLSNQFFSLFKDGKLLQESSSLLIIIITFSLLIMSTAVVYFNALIGLGKIKATFIIEIFAVIIYLIYTFVTIDFLHLSYNIGWLNEIIYWSCMGMIAYHIYTKRIKLQLLTERTSIQM